jgi:hypothetical protein
VALSSFAAPVFADAHNVAVREVAIDADLYTVLGGPAHVVVVTLSPMMLTYGSGTVSATVSGALPMAQGSVPLLDGGTVVSSGVLAGSVAVLPANTLSAGAHALTAAFAGDGIHAAAASPVAMLSVAPLAATATATGATMVYGGAVPLLTGTLAGILARDVGSVAVGFTAVAPGLAAVGSYPIAASLSGEASANYTLTLSADSGALQVVQATPLVTMNVPQISYAGLPLTLTALVAPALRGTPTGSVNFLDGGTVVGTGNVAGGVATAIDLSAGAGPHSLTAAYMGDGNFAAATSAPELVSVSAMPDFAVTATGASQTVVGGGIANFSLQIAASPGPFSGSVSMSASGLPAGATVGFSPAAVVPGSGSAAVTMSVQTTTLAMRSVTSVERLAGLFVFGLVVVRRRRLAIAVVGVIFIVGCGDRTFSSSSLAANAAQTFPITVTATSTNLVGALVVHSTSVTLIVE